MQRLHSRVLVVSFWVLWASTKKWYHTKLHFIFPLAGKELDIKSSLKEKWVVMPQQNWEMSNITAVGTALCHITLLCFFKERVILHVHLNRTNKGFDFNFLPGIIEQQYYYSEWRGNHFECTSPLIRTNHTMVTRDNIKLNTQNKTLPFWMQLAGDGAGQSILAGCERRQEGKEMSEWKTGNP